jgi:hypothetical protein
MQEISPIMQRNVCSHNPKCSRAFIVNTHNDGFMVCENDMKDTVYETMKLLGMVPENYTLPKNDTGWTIRQEKLLADYINENGVQYGAYSIIGELVGKTRRQVKDKVHRMKRDGKL